MRALFVVVLLGVLLFTQYADAQTTVSPADRREVSQTYYGSGTGGSTFVFNYTSTGGSYSSETRLFFEFNLSAYGDAGAAVFNFSASAIPGYSGTIYLRPMTAGEDGSVTTGDFSLLGSPIWTGSILSGNAQSFSVPVTSWFNARNGGFGGFALTAAPLVGGFVSAAGNSGTIDFTPVPEPGTFALFGLGLGSLFLGYRARRKKTRK